MRFVDDDEVVACSMVDGAAAVIHVGATKRFECYEIGLGTGRRERGLPHRGQCSGSYYQAAIESAGNGKGDEGLSHPDIVAQQGAIELIDRGNKPFDR